MLLVELPDVIFIFDMRDDLIKASKTICHDSNLLRVVPVRTICQKFSHENLRTNQKDAVVCDLVEADIGKGVEKTSLNLDHKVFSVNHTIYAVDDSLSEFPTIFDAEIDKFLDKVDNVVVYISHLVYNQVDVCRSLKTHMSLYKLIECFNRYLLKMLHRIIHSVFEQLTYLVHDHQKFVVEVKLDEFVIRDK